MSEENITPEHEETPEVEAHASDVLGLQKLEDGVGFSANEATSCSSVIVGNC